MKTELPFLIKSSAAGDGEVLLFSGGEGVGLLALSIVSQQQSQLTARLLSGE